MLEERDLDFLRALWSRKVAVTYVLFGINIAIFVLMTLAGGTGNDATLLAFGVKANSKIDNGEIWRVVTPIFIHIGLLHLFFNSYALWVVGPQVEKLYGKERFLTIYVMTGVVGVLASYWQHPGVFSAGASGAIFGLFGTLFAFGLKYRNSIPHFFQRAVGASVLPAIVINLIIGFSVPGIDNAAHIGGLIAGALLAFMIPYEQPGTSTPQGFKFLQSVWIVIIAASFYQVASHYDGPSLSFRNVSAGWGGLFGGNRSVDGFLTAINSAQSALDESTGLLSSGNAAKEDIEFLKPRLKRAVDQLQRAPALNSKADRIARDLLALAQAEYQLVEDVERSGTMTFAHRLSARQNAKRYADLSRELSNWVDEEGAAYGIQLGKQP